MFRKFVCVFLIVWLVASPAYAATSSSALDWQVAPMSLDDDIMTVASGDYSSVGMSWARYDVESGSFHAGSYTSVSGSVASGDAFLLPQTDVGFDSSSPFVGFALNFNGMNSSMGNTWQISLNKFLFMYAASVPGDSQVKWLNVNPMFSAPAYTMAVCDWSGSGKYTNPTTGSTSWKTMSGTVRLPVNVSASDISEEYPPTFSTYRYVGNVNMSVTFDLPSSVTEDGYTYEITSGSVKSMRIYVVYPFRTASLFGLNCYPVLESFPGLDLNGAVITSRLRFLYASGEPKITVSVMSAAQSSNGLAQLVGGVGQSISVLQQNVTKQITEVKNTIQQGASEVKNEISNQTQTLTDKLTNVKDGIVNGITELKETTEQGFKDVVQGITDLPGKMQEMLTDFIVPDEDTVADKMTDFQSLAEEKLGVVYQVPTMMFDMAEGIISGVSNPEGEMVLPKFEIIMPATNQTRSGETLTVWEEYRFAIWPAGTEVIQTAVQTATSMICVIFTFNALKRKYEEWLDGH